MRPSRRINPGELAKPSTRQTAFRPDWVRVSSHNLAPAMQLKKAHIYHPIRVLIIPDIDPAGANPSEASDSSNRAVEKNGDHGLIHGLYIGYDFFVQVNKDLCP